MSASHFPPTDHLRLDVIRKLLSTPVIGDVLDAMGRTHQFLPQRISHVDPSMKVVGRAMPVLVCDVFGPQSNPFGKLPAALDDLRAGEVYVAHGARSESALWGELLTVAARTRGAVGAVVDGFHRDTPQILTEAWPVFSAGAYAQDSAVRAAVLDFRIPIEVSGVAIAPGDLVVGDMDGVLIVPSDIEFEVVEAALEKVSAEKEVRRAIEQGVSVTDAFGMYGVL
ncbi:MAG: RraA family protein [Microbacteriaceae bacterium]|nr:RraA family protein [Microbacteriaceae bacterium]